MRTPQGATLVPALALILAFVVYGPALADPAGDERYLRLENAQRFYAQMADFAQMQGPLVEVSDRRGLPALVQRGTAVAADVFAVDPASEAMRERLAAVPGDVPIGFDAILERMRSLEEDLSSRSIEMLQAGEAAWLAHYEARSDRASINAISDAMAAPELARETAITGLRVKWIYETLLTGDMDKLRDMTPDMIETGTQDVLNRTRAPDDSEYGAPPFRKEFVREQARMFRRMILSHLPEADVSALATFYASETGRASAQPWSMLFANATTREADASSCGFSKRRVVARRDRIHPVASDFNPDMTGELTCSYASYFPQSLPRSLPRTRSLRPHQQRIRCPSSSQTKRSTLRPKRA